MEIRKITIGDNVQVARLIRSILEDMGVPKVGTAYEDTALDVMFETYQSPRSIFFVAVDKEKIVACGGLAPLQGGDGTIGELQKMYVAPEFRKKGLATAIMGACLHAAKKFGFEAIYLETLPEMEAAQALYAKNGFTYCERPMGQTGHHNCSVRMIKRIHAA